MRELIDRQETLNAIDERFESLVRRFDYDSYENADEKTKLVCDGLSEAEDVVMGMPSAQPEIIYCKDCVKHNKGLGNYEVHPDGSTTWIWKDSACPLVSWRDKAQGHEFDYQFCAYAERREVTE